MREKPDSQGAKLKGIRLVDRILYTQKIYSLNTETAISEERNEKLISYLFHSIDNSFSFDLIYQTIQYDEAENSGLQKKTCILGCSNIKHQ